MPCRCDYPESEGENPRLREEADKATRAACDMRTIIRKYAPATEIELTPETRKWIAQHDKEDAKRIAEENKQKIRENTRLRALEKLTLEERRVLGL